MTTPETPEQAVSFDLSRRTERDVAVEIARHMAAFRGAHNLADMATGGPAPSPSPAPSPNPARAAPIGEFDAPGSPADGFAGAGLRASDPGYADVQTHPLFLHAHKLGQAPWRRRAGLRPEARLRVAAGGGEEPPPYGSAFAELLAGDADAARDECPRQRQVARPGQAPARRRSRRAAFLAAAALVLAAAGGVLWQFGAVNLANDSAPWAAPVIADVPVASAEAASLEPALAVPSDLAPASHGASGAPPLVAVLKPDVPVATATERSARVMTASASGPFDPLADLLSPLTQKFGAAGRALGGGTAGADLRESAMGNGGNK